MVIECYMISVDTAKIYHKGLRLLRLSFEQ